MKTFKELQASIVDWADTHHLLCEENAQKQFMKFMEEVIEFKTEMDMRMKFFEPNLKMWKIDRDVQLEMGDVFVTLIILCEQLNISPQTCLSMAYDKIKDRKGETINGTFVKEEDL